MVLAAVVDPATAVSPAVDTVGHAIGATVGGALVIAGGLLALRVAWGLAKRLVSTSFAEDSDYGGWSGPEGYDRDGEPMWF